SMTCRSHSWTYPAENGCSSHDQIASLHRLLAGPAVAGLTISLMNNPHITETAAAEASVVADIAEVGALTRSLAKRYEGIFSHFRSVLLETLQGAETMADAARSAMAMTEAASASFRDSFPNQPVYACKSACAACCHLFVAVPPGVAEAIAAH